LAQRLTVVAAAEGDKPASASCQQCLYITLFFDGTGNNLEADLPTLEHSSVARMFRAMPKDSPATGVFRRYIPGIGTYFPEIGDNGKGPIPVVDTHNGMGAMGQDRLDWAFAELKQIVTEAEARAQNPSNKILWLKLAVFGFSRGATLARAFVRDLLNPAKGMSQLQGDKLLWKSAGCLLSIEFMGLWDTVASVGLPMSANNVDAVRSDRRRGSNVARRLLNDRPQMLRAVDLAFGRPGADPAPGRADGHADWADDLSISPLVKQCVHMVAAHEVRNSFPVDSVLRGASKGSNCKEIVYPGAHSNVGGGYRPGEGGKGVASPASTDNTSMEMALSLVPLRAMYNEAVLAGVPLRAMGGAKWEADNKQDFAISERLIERFNHYMTQAGWGGKPIGGMLLDHMRWYFAWRWARIAMGRQAGQQRVAQNEQVFARDRAALERRKAQLLRERESARQRGTQARQSAQMSVQGQWMNPKPDLNGIQANRQRFLDQERAASADVERLNRELKEVQARLDGAANDADLAENESAFDAELLHDVRSILAAIEKDPKLRAQLRPHYRNLVETYELEFNQRRGLRDEKVLAFFDDHVHDSLAGFNQDSTLPSDPRVVYVGGDVKLLYASLDLPHRMDSPIPQSMQA
jgi:hypothetical protein